MGLRTGLEHTNSFVRLQEILMSNISLKLQDKNYFSKLSKLTHTNDLAAEQGPRPESVQN